MVLCGHDWAGGTLGGATLVSMVTVFVQGRYTQIKNLKQKRSDPDEVQHLSLGASLESQGQQPALPASKHDKGKNRRRGK